MHLARREQASLADLQHDLQRSTEEADKLRLTAARVPGLQSRLAAYESKADETSKRHEVRFAKAPRWLASAQELLTAACEFAEYLR